MGPFVACQGRLGSDKILTKIKFCHMGAWNKTEKLGRIVRLQCKL